MGSFATCKFPGVDKMYEIGEKNPVVGYINSVLSGFGQIVFLNVKHLPSDGRYIPEPCREHIHHRDHQHTDDNEGKDHQLLF